MGVEAFDAEAPILITRRPGAARMRQTLRSRDREEAQINASPTVAGASAAAAEVPACLPTSVARRIGARMQRTHDRRRISIFSGPPGIGKTTAIEAFRVANECNVAVAKIAKRGSTEGATLQHALEAVRLIATDRPRGYISNSAWTLRQNLYDALCDYSGFTESTAHRFTSADEYPLLTLIFDEAQNLSRASIEMLRYWNDSDRCYGPFPIGLVFVGNHEFSLKVDNSGNSMISEAVADRALYVEQFSYGDLSNEDLALFTRSRGVGDPGAIAAIVRHFSAPRAIRSFRRIADFLDDLTDEAGGEPITLDTVRSVLDPT